MLTISSRKVMNNKKLQTNQQKSLISNKLPSLFYKLLNRAILYSPTEDQTNESQNSCDYTDKQTRLHKFVNTSD